MILFEVIVAMTIFIIAGLSAVVWVRQTVLTVEKAHTAVEEVGAASDYLDRVALWTREDLDRHLGSRRQGPWTVRIGRPTPTVYEVAVFDSNGSRILLHTWVYRAELPREGTPGDR
jgi:type II secretory pathway pseudopilin PulG